MNSTTHVTSDTTTDSAAVDLRGIGLRLGEFALTDVDLHVPRGYIAGLVGPNGAGKTTLIKCLLGIVRPERGDVRVLGLPQPAEGPAIAEQLGVVLDHPFYAPEWTVAQTAKALRPFYRDWDDERFVYLTRRFGLSPSKQVKELSRGMGMKLMMAAALSHRARLLLLDEPTSGLDPAAREELLDLLQDYCQEDDRTVLFSTHQTADLQKIADTVTFIDQGRIVEHGETDMVVDRYVMVRGGPDQLTDANQGATFGLRRQPHGFDALVLAADRDLFPGTVIERPTLDELVARRASHQEVPQ